ncbi:hypothetical protein RYX36_020229 [Vicia faba]
MQLVINDIATPPIFKIQEPTRELPPGTFKVFDNKMFKPICEANNPTAVNFLSLTDGPANPSIEDKPNWKNKKIDTPWNAGRHNAVTILESNVIRACSASGTADPKNREFLKTPPVSIFLAELEQFKGTQIAASNKKITATKLSMKNQARRKSQLKGIKGAKLELNHDMDTITVKKRSHTGEVVTSELIEQVNKGTNAVEDMILEGVDLDLGAAGLDKTMQQVPKMLSLY